MEKIVWGEAIEVNGKKPEWLGDELINPVWFGNMEDGDFPSGAQWEHCSHTIITHIKLPADHFAYTAIAQGFTPWGGGESAPEDWDGGPVLVRDGRVDVFGSWTHPWYGGDGETPHDIIGYRLRADALPEDVWIDEDYAPKLGKEWFATAAWEPATTDQLIADFYQKFGAVSDDSPRHIRILDALTDIDETTVVVNRMSEVEALAMWAAITDSDRSFNDDFLEALCELGILPPAAPTPLDQFIASNPGVVNDENRAAVELALGWGK